MISILLPDLRGGGAERVAVDLANAFADLGHCVEFVLLRAEGEFLQQVELRHKIVDLHVERVRNLPRKLVYYLRNTPPDALLVAMWPLTVVAPIAARLAGFSGPVGVSEHGILSLQYQGRSRLHRLALRMSTWAGYRLADARIGVSEGVCRDMSSLSGLPVARIRNIGNPLRPLVTPDATRRSQAEASWNSDCKRILTVGSLKDVKNHALLLRAFALLPRGAACLMILGKGRNEASLRMLAEELGIADQVIFAGFHSDPTPFYMTANLLALSSNSEGFGNVIVEALSCGLPVVSTNCPSGPAEILENGRYGRLTPVGDAEALARAMAEALEAPVDLEALKRRAADFAPERAASSYLDALGLS